MKGLKLSLVGTASAAALAITSLPVAANPLGGQVVGGAATIAGETTNQVTVIQSTEKAIVDWRSFDLAPTDTTQFVQPDTSAVTLNRVTGGLGASQIDGIINANGNVYVVNPDGILFGKNAVINTNSFLGTTHDIANGDFMAGNLNFDITGNPTASIVNEGTITAANGGFAALVAPGVRNDGIITANLGTVDLSAGNGFTLDLFGDNLITLQPSDSVANNVKDVATGETLKSLVRNTGTLRANGGKVILTAVAAKQVLDSVINTSGTVEADTVGTHKGQVIFGASTSKAKPGGAPKQTVKIAGRLSASGKDTGTSGGKIQITGEDIQLVDTTLNASGTNGGGTIIVGGDFKGGDPSAPAVTLFGKQFEARPVPTATTVTADADTILDVSATQNGNGGNVVVWADGRTMFLGAADATGGSAGGNGGFIEVSGGSSLLFAGHAVTAAPDGIGGTLLLDPSDLYVVSDATANANVSFSTPTPTATNIEGSSSDPQSDSYIRASTIEDLLNTTSVYVTTEVGNIYIDSPIIAPDSQYSLTIENKQHFNVLTDQNITYTPDIYFNAPIDFSRSTGSLTLDAAHDLIISPDAFIVAETNNFATMFVSAGYTYTDYPDRQKIGHIDYQPGHPLTIYVRSLPGRGELIDNQVFNFLSWVGPTTEPVGLWANYIVYNDNSIGSVQFSTDAPPAITNNSEVAPTPGAPGGSDPQTPTGSDSGAPRVGRAICQTKPQYCFGISIEAYLLAEAFQTLVGEIEGGPGLVLGSQLFRNTQDVGELADALDRLIRGRWVSQLSMNEIIAKLKNGTLKPQQVPVTSAFVNGREVVLNKAAAAALVAAGIPEKDWVRINMDL